MSQTDYRFPTLFSLTYALPTTGARGRQIHVYYYIVCLRLRWLVLTPGHCLRLIVSDVHGPAQSPEAREAQP